MAQRNIGALWNKTAKSGLVYQSGVLQTLAGDVYITVYTNDKKTADNQPDFNIVLNLPDGLYTDKQK